VLLSEREGAPMDHLDSFGKSGIFLQLRDSQAKRWVWGIQEDPPGE